MRCTVALLVCISLSNPDHVTVQQQLISANCDANHPNASGRRVCESLDTGRMDARLQAEGSRSFIPKESFSADRRVVFVAGLEGSGHHLWRDMFEQCTHTGDCVGSADLASLLWSQSDKSGVFNHYEPSGDYDDATIQRVRSAFRATSSTEGLLWLNGAHERGIGRTGMMSYPNFGGPEKIFQHPDVWLLAQIAEDVGEDFRILFLGRRARALLTSTVVHRHFAPYGPEAVILAYNARVLASQLRALDAKFVRCVEYEDMPDLPTDLSSWLDPAEYAFEAAAAAVFAPDRAAAASQAVPAVPVDPLRDVAIAHLEEALAELHIAAGCPSAATG